MMTKKGLEEAIKTVDQEIKNPPRSAESRPYPYSEVKRREMLLLKQLTLCKTADAKSKGEKTRNSYIPKSILY